MSFAVIKTGGKQYKVSKGDSIKVEKIKAKKELKEGDKISFDEVLLTDSGKTTKVGTPLIKGAKVEGTIEKIGRAKKISVIRFKSKSRHFKRKGHRQPFFQIKIEKIS
jgi:large subunit ribosomal protein L21